MERNTRKNGLINLLALLVAAVASYAVAKYGRTLTGGMAAVFMGLGVLVAAVSWFQMRLEERERLEKLEFDELTKSASGSTLFTTGETEVFPAQRSREQFERFFVPAFAVILFLLEAGGALLFWHGFAKSTPVPLAQPLVCLGMFCMFFLLLFLLGRYATSLVRMEDLRLLRPGATYLLLCAYLCLLVVASVGFSWVGIPKNIDLYLARLLIGLLLLIGLETLINLLLEMYRPRVKGKVQRPLYESRLVSLLGQPEGLITTAAQTLDYQFGFKVSETWGYQLFARWLPWLIVGQLAVLLLSTTVVFIDPGEAAVLERYGRFMALLEPGAHLKLPWPVDRTYRFAAEQIQTVDVGFTPEEDKLAGNTVLWTVAHTKEDNFLVANRGQAAPVTGTNDAAAQPPPVSLLTVSIPVQFQITNLKDWFYNNESPRVLLQDLATHEVVQYLVSADLQELLSRGRGDAAVTLQNKIQAAADRHQLGVRIILVGLQDIHPPVKVAADYEKVIGAEHETNAAILNALAWAIQTNAVAVIQAQKTISEAESERQRLETNAMAQSELFTNQVPAYLASPSVYLERAYLETFVQSIANARVYILLATNTRNVAILNLEDKIRPDILDVPVLPPPPKSPNPASKP